MRCGSDSYTRANCAILQTSSANPHTTPDHPNLQASTSPGRACRRLAKPAPCLIRKLTPCDFAGSSPNLLRVPSISPSDSHGSSRASAHAFLSSAYMPLLISPPGSRTSDDESEWGIATAASENLGDESTPAPQWDGALDAGQIAGEGGDEDGGVLAAHATAEDEVLGAAAGLGQSHAIERLFIEISKLRRMAEGGAAGVLAPSSPTLAAAAAQVAAPSAAQPPPPASPQELLRHQRHQLRQQQRQLLQLQRQRRAADVADAAEDLAAAYRAGGAAPDAAAEEAHAQQQPLRQTGEGDDNTMRMVAALTQLLRMVQEDVAAELSTNAVRTLGQVAADSAEVLDGLQVALGPVVG